MKKTNTISPLEAIFLGLALVLLLPAETPRRKMDEIECTTEESIEDLDRKRLEAVENQDFEYAAVLRDKIAARRGQCLNS